MTPWRGATGASFRRKRKIGSRSATNLAARAQRGTGRRTFEKCGKHLVIQYVAF